ncbi:MAG: anaerobic C4-dicarboxylate transporter [Phycisphaerales bacterium]
MFWLELIIVLLMLIIGARRGGIFLGMMGGVGMAILVFGLQLTPSAPPVNILLIIISVILAASTMQAAGGMEYMVGLAESLLRKNPARITFLAPIVAYLFSFMTGTANVVFSLLPVIAEVARESGIRPERPLVSAVIATQLVIIASPLSAAIAAMVGFLAPLNITLIDILMVTIPATIVGVLAGAFYCSRMGKDLDKDPEYLERLANGEVPPLAIKEYSKTPFAQEAKSSVLLFLLGAIVVVLMGTSPSLRPTLNYAGKAEILSMPLTITIVMIAIAAIMVLVCRVNVSKIVEGTVFKSGMMAVVIVLGVAWMSDTVAAANNTLITGSLKAMVSSYPWLFTFALAAVATLTASQAVTTAALMPIGLMLGIPGSILLGLFPAVACCFILPTSSSMVACVALDSTKTTKIGKYVVNNSYVLPGLFAMVVSIIVGSLLARLVF